MSAALIVALVTILSLVYQRWRRMTILRRNGIPGPSPNWIFGNAAEVHEKGMSNCFLDWQKRFGDVVGFYLGGIPHVVVMDVDLVKRIQVQDFSNFSEHDSFLKGGLWGSELGNAHLFFTSKWSQHRPVLNSNFTPAKLKAYVDILKVRIAEQMETFSNMANDEIEMEHQWTNLTFANSSSALLGLDPNRETVGKFSQLLKNLAMVDVTANFGIVYLLFPELTFLFYPIRKWLSELKERLRWSDFGKMMAVGTPLVKERRANPEKFRHEKHFLQRIVEEKTLTDDDVIANAFFFLLAAQDTTASTLSYVTHFLVNHPRHQDQLREEVRELIARDGELNYNVLNGLPKVTAFMEETLRCLPPLSLAVTRRSMSDYDYVNSEGRKFTIPEGCGVEVGVMALHHDERHWDSPSEFRPQRFEDGLKLITEPFAYQAFGQGPRQCIGMRFAQIAAKLAVSELLLRFEVLPSPRTEIGLPTTKEFFGTLVPAKGVYVQLRPVA